MKLRLQIESGPHVSYFCDGWAETAPKTGVIPVRLLGAHLPDFKKQAIECRILMRGKTPIAGTIRKLEKDDQFVFIKEGNQ